MQPFEVPFATLPAIPKARRDHAPWRPRGAATGIHGNPVSNRPATGVPPHQLGRYGGVRLDITVTCPAGHMERDLPLPKKPKSAILASKSPGILRNID